MLLDGHIHIMDEGRGNRQEFGSNLRKAGVDGGLLISPPPASFHGLGGGGSAGERLDILFDWAGSGDRLFPFFWIDPLEEDALEQVMAAVERGVSGFKVICNRFYPYEYRPLEIFHSIAATGKPILFHSGILWDGQDSSRYNRPVNFEALLEVEHLTFAMAHISWPWCDEMLAVCGKFLSARRRHPEKAPNLYMDTTPGTPAIYRREALVKLYTIGYDVQANVFWGSDCHAAGYLPDAVRSRQAADMAILQEIGLSQAALDGYCADNLRRFVGLAP